jgi:hypothetical protein
MVLWKVLDKDGLEVELELKAYHMPLASVHLLSPQALIKSIKHHRGELIFHYFLSATRINHVSGLVVSTWRMIRLMIGQS